MALSEAIKTAIQGFNSELSTAGETLLKWHIYTTVDWFRTKYFKAAPSDREKIEQEVFEKEYIKNEHDKMDPYTLLNIFNGVIWPAISDKDSSLVDHPDDELLTSMRGVTITNLFGKNGDKFDLSTAKRVFTSNGQNTSEQKDFEKIYITLVEVDKKIKNATLSIGDKKEVLNLMFNQEIAAKLWFVKECGFSTTHGKPLEIMKDHNAYLGYFLMLNCWLQGQSGMTNVKGKSKTLKAVMTDNFSKFPNSIKQDPVKAVTASVQLVQTYYEWLQKQKENENEKYYEGWKSRFFSDKRSTVNMLVVINEKVNINAAGEFKYTPKFKTRLATMGAAYSTKFSINIGD
tara:strand:+ start:493 stop:1527 length:1035 start_codon:yes stop_codon:yes gene_type:complete